MSFCLDDGAELLYGPRSADETQTAIFADFGANENAAAVVGGAAAGKMTTRNSIAVLPFANISADEDNEYFCDGLAEELLNALAKIDELKVAEVHRVRRRAPHAAEKVGIPHL